jgi:hypothetical protein
MKTLLIIAGIVAGLAAPATAADNRQRTVKYDAPACRSAKIVDHIITLASEHDDAAFNAFLMQKFANGDCVDLHAGTRVFVEDYGGFLSDAVCVRPQRQTECVWTGKKVISDK